MLTITSILLVNKVTPVIASWEVEECYSHLNLIILLKDVVESFEIQVHSAEVNGTSRMIYEFSLDPFSSHIKFFVFDMFSDNPKMRASASEYEGGGIIEISFEVYKKYTINLFGDGAEILEAVNGSSHGAKGALATKFCE